ncbi:hypothetical protein Ais01nite_32470 [Asanoa ishikariensis]|uniref:Lipoprotein n=1 Tax=Asanoa ishikariensis TaxID=137265 RepID=A0A1H3UXU2_9ACTN|nr:hypothetical protein [Asanoa ishikariensis]GIF65212.1 hypothetical protein Ais01nite_32470 [Asanoa ishikariensis]SDZ66645.1 hypothetical protein SAMN05421684_8249 [Asanoa ishikariensis]
MRTFRTPLVLLTAVAATLLTGCGEKPGNNLGAETPTGASYVIGEDTPTDADLTPSPSATAIEPAGGENGGSNGGEQRKDPWIQYFRISQKPHCPSGQWPNGREVTVEWKVTGTDKVTISVDGPGVYDTFDASGSQSFSFSCGDWGPGETAKHTYLLMTVGGGPVAKKTITATATVSGGTTGSPSPAAEQAAPDAP